MKCFPNCPGVSTKVWLSRNFRTGPSRTAARSTPGLPLLGLPVSRLDLIALLNIVGGSAGAIALAAKVSPEGGNCRTITKVVIVSIYLAKFLAQRYLLNRPESTMRKI